MDRNLLLAFALSMAVFSGWLAWQQSMVVPEREAAAEQARLAQAADPAPDLSNPSPPQVSEIPLPPETPDAAPIAPSAPARQSQPVVSARPDDTPASVALWE